MTGDVREKLVSKIRELVYGLGEIQVRNRIILREAGYRGLLKTTQVIASCGNDYRRFTVARLERILGQLNEALSPKTKVEDHHVFVVKAWNKLRLTTVNGVTMLIDQVASPTVGLAVKLASVISEDLIKKVSAGGLIDELHLVMSKPSQKFEERFPVGFTRMSQAEKDAIRSMEAKLGVK